MSKRRRQFKRGQKFSRVTYRAISTPERWQSPPRPEGKPWRERPPHSIILPIKDKPHVIRRMYHQAGEYIIVDYYVGSKVEWESKVYDRIEAFYAHEYDCIEWVCQYPVTRGTATEGR